MLCFVFTCSGNHKQRFYWGNKEIIIPGKLTPPTCVVSCDPHPIMTVYKEMIEAVRKHPDVDVMINFASLRSAYDATMESLAMNQVCWGLTLPREGGRDEAI